VPLGRLSVAILPFIGVMLVVLLLIAFIPGLTTWVIR
jgi:TRAP-type C4-dicarboxylate transport system permease large subunit